MNRYAQGKFTGQYKATIGADFLTKDVVVTDVYGQRHFVTLQIWDTAGQERFQSLGVGFYRGSDGALLVYDVTDPASLDHLAHWQQEFLQHVGGGLGGNAFDQPAFPFVVVGNKADKASQRKVPPARAIEWCQSHATGIPGGMMTQTSLPHYEASAKTGVVVDDVFSEIARLALQYEDYRRRSQPQLFVPPAPGQQPIDLRHQQSSFSQSGGDNCC
jgi:Ras-related protein Rab-7A